METSRSKDGPFAFEPRKMDPEFNALIERFAGLMVAFKAVTDDNSRMLFERSAFVRKLPWKITSQRERPSFMDLDMFCVRFELAPITLPMSANWAAELPVESIDEIIDAGVEGLRERARDAIRTTLMAARRAGQSDQA